MGVSDTVQKEKNTRMPAVEMMTVSSKNLSTASRRDGRALLKCQGEWEDVSFAETGAYDQERWRAPLVRGTGSTAIS